METPEWWWRGGALAFRVDRRGSSSCGPRFLHPQSGNQERAPAMALRCCSSGPIQRDGEYGQQREHRRFG